MCQGFIKARLLCVEQSPSAVMCGTVGLGCYVRGIRRLFSWIRPARAPPVVPEEGPTAPNLDLSQGGRMLRRTVPKSALPPRRGGFGSAQACLRFLGAVACRRAKPGSDGGETPACLLWQVKATASRRNPKTLRSSCGRRGVHGQRRMAALFFRVFPLPSDRNSLQGSSGSAQREKKMGSR